MTHFPDADMVEFQFDADGSSLDVYGVYTPEILANPTGAYRFEATGDPGDPGEPEELEILCMVQKGIHLGQCGQNLVEAAFGDEILNLFRERHSLERNYADECAIESRYDDCSYY